MTSYAFTGQYRDSILGGLQYHRARWLNLQHGGWLSPDPVFDFPGNFGSPYGCAKHSTINSLDPSGAASFVEVVTVAGIITSVAAVCVPFLGAAYLAARGKISFSQTMRHLIRLETWLAAFKGMLLGAGAMVALNMVAMNFIKKIGIEASKRVLSIFGLIASVVGLVESIKMTWQMITGELPAHEAEKFIAIMIAGIVLTAIIGKASKSRRIRTWFGRGAKNDDVFWGLSPDDKKAYMRAQELLPNDVYAQAPGNSLDEILLRGRMLSQENPFRRMGTKIRGFWQGTVNSLKDFTGIGASKGINFGKWLATGPTPDYRFVANDNLFNGVVSGILINGEGSL